MENVNLEHLQKVLDYDAKKLRNFFCEMGMAVPISDDEMFDRRDSLLKTALRIRETGFIEKVLKSL